LHVPTREGHGTSVIPLGSPAWDNRVENARSFRFETPHSSFTARKELRAAQGELLQSARLWGAAEALRQAIGAPIPPVFHGAYERSVRAARAQLGGKAFTAAWAERRTMPLEQVLTSQRPVTMLLPDSTDPVTAPPIRKASTYPDELTVREVEVLRLVAQVAQQLVISPRTVNSHLKAIYGKIGVPSRSAATRYAIEHNLM
jgi:DNA-binding CsgD family transcriptional regulator